MESALQTFVERWSKSAGAERANYQLFLAELCDALGVARPEPTVEEDSQNAYVFERNVRFDNRDGTHSIKRIDLYKRGCFVCETKQGVEKEDEETPSKRNAAMFRAVGQAQQYARTLPVEEGRPPFLVVIDVGQLFCLSWTSSFKCVLEFSTHPRGEVRCRKDDILRRSRK